MRRGVLNKKMKKLRIRMIVQRGKEFREGTVMMIEGDVGIRNSTRMVESCAGCRPRS